MNCPYKLLGLEKGSNIDQIKAAYRNLSMKYHPDIVNGIDLELELQLKEINKAYNILRKEKSRTIYDRHCETSYYNKEFINDLDLKVVTNGNNNKLNGEDVYITYGVSLEQINESKDVKIEYKTLVECLACSNKDRILVTDIIERNISNKVTLLGWNASSTNNLNHDFNKRTNSIKLNKCLKCNASRRLLGIRSVTFNASIGTENNNSICFNKKGEAGTNGGLAGNLWIKIITKSHEFYNKDNLNLYCVLRIKPITAAIGGRLILNTLTGSFLSIEISKQRLQNIYLIENKRGLMDKNGNVGNINIKLSLKNNNYKIIPSFKLSTKTLFTLYKLNMLLETIL
ncbi:Chaperone protein DnaJ [Candidatus Hodgkinia cicadicola]|uniref:Chaperone protein DnaJ n=1 Tax=Candidatus Hodgkinia cicadicola TaxID=573658 RepID=A0ABX4MJ78_9HYPH|nr:Chaperone protein DnaJ [Candidatus Hodgkinia cicadicola]